MIEAFLVFLVFLVAATPVGLGAVYHFMKHDQNQENLKLISSGEQKLLEANTILEEENIKLKFELLEALEEKVSDEMVAKYLKLRERKSRIAFEPRSLQQLLNMQEEIKKLRDMNERP